MKVILLLKNSFTSVKSARSLYASRLSLVATRLSTTTAKERKFSESDAYYGMDKDRRKPPAKYVYDYYKSDEFNIQRLYSILLSIAAATVYFAWLREPSDLDEILTTPSHILTANVERRMLREQIRDAKKKGQDTTLLEQQLSYVDVKETAMKVQFDKN